MPPKKNVAPSNAVRQFWCEICKKGYPRQPDYENHLRSYDHNHRQRLADMKKFTAQNDTDTKKRSPDDMRSIPLDGAAKKPNLGPRFTKVTGDVGQSRFKKVGTSTKTGTEEEKVVTEGRVEDKEGHTKSVEQLMKENEDLKRQLAVAQGPEKKKEEEEETDWVPYSFENPTGCERENCLGHQTIGIWNDAESWVKIACDLSQDDVHHQEDVVERLAEQATLRKHLAKLTDLEVDVH